MTTDELYETLDNGNFSVIKEAETEELWHFALNPISSWGVLDTSILARVLRELHSRYPHAYRPDDDEESEDDDDEADL